MGFWDYVILAAVAAMVGLAVFVLTRRKKAGKGSCGECDRCSCCSGAANCTKKEDSERVS